MSKVVDVNIAPFSSVSLPWWEPETALPVEIFSVEHPKEGEKDHTMGKTHVSKGSQNDLVSLQEHAEILSLDTEGP